MSLNAEARSEWNTELLQNRFTHKYKSITKSFKDRNEKEENPREAWEDPDFDEYQDMKGREEDDEHKTKTIKNQTRLQSSPMIDPAVPDRHGQVATTSSKQYATYPERERLSGRASDGEWSVLGWWDCL